MWDPAQYALFAGHRGRPFGDLLARVEAPSPRLVVDLGCGDGLLTRGLAQRWPQARVVGIDSSPQMLAAARADDTQGRVEWLLERVETWDPAGLGAGVDVIVTNATLQWVPGHLGLIPRWVDVLEPGGWFAMQVPANYDAPSHRLMREVASRHPRAADLAPGLRRAAAVAEPAAYLELLSSLGLGTDVWETTYLHVLDPEGTLRSPVLEWVRATGLRPVLDVLTDRDELAAFLEDYTAALDEAYPRRAHGVVLPFRRVFAVARREPVAS
ncbi:MAG TPA: methyltransferase domain-containing protein [Candidatus Lustribacter sp.]|nr:methyltransferase domain-containing protein [Candidatus Lustribacter sp.]